jgi:hypothetical protein
MKSQYLLATILIGRVGLDRAAGDYAKAVELVAPSIEVITAVIGSSTFDDGVEAFDIVGG